MRCAEIAEAEGAEVVLGDWSDETTHRRHAQQVLRDRGVGHCLIPDGDEIVEPRLLEALLDIGEKDLAEIASVFMDTYWKSPEYVIRPRESLTPALMINLRKVQHHHIREYRGGRHLTLEPGYGLLHHLSYVGPDERIVRKIQTWSHREELVPNWLSWVYLGWNEDRRLCNLHPTHPQAYGFAERIPVPEILRGVRSDSLGASDPAVPNRWPTVSVVIPLFGGEGDIQNCLDSLARCGDLLHEIIVVDDASPDGAAAVAGGYDSVKLLINDTNGGFAKACNRGYEASTGEVVLFLNSDTVVARAALLRLVESLISSPNIAAAGPLSNNAGYHQRTGISYTSEETIDLFAQDFAARDVDDQDVALLVGFCLAARRTALEHVKEDGAVFDERFGQGLFEDNDLCYRLIRAGFRLRLSNRSFVHHGGSQSLARMNINPQVLLTQNMHKFHDKWREDIECGFASHLPGQKAEQIQFNFEKDPDAIRKRIRRLASKARVSLTMIVRDEERVLGDCLASARDAFWQRVVVDTGSKDGTVNLARSYGCEVYESPWQDSFSQARNVALSYATGDWVFWMDADDVLPLTSAEAILNEVLNAPREVVGFVIPVQFVGEDRTRVDHVKVFRNIRTLQWEHRIHEQILPSLSPHGLVARIDAVVMHANYDNTPEGQRKKRKRDWRLLLLDLKEHPNHPFVLFNLGMTAHFTGRHRRAVTWLRQGLNACAGAETHIRKAYALLASSLRELGETDAALAACFEGLLVVRLGGFPAGLDRGARSFAMQPIEPAGEPIDPELHYLAAELLAKSARYAESKQQFLLIPEGIDGHYSSVDLNIIGAKRLHRLGEVCLAMREREEAGDWWGRAVELGYAASAVRLFQLFFDRRDYLSAGEALNSLRGIEGASESWAALGAQLAQAMGSSPDAFLYRAAGENPSSVGPALVLANRLVEIGQEQAAEPHVRFLEEMGTPDGPYLRGLIAVRHNDISGAEKFIDRALELGPGHTRAIELKEKLSRFRLA